MYSPVPSASTPPRLHSSAQRAVWRTAKGAGSPSRHDRRRGARDSALASLLRTECLWNAGGMEALLILMEELEKNTPNSRCGHPRRRASSEVRRSRAWALGETALWHPIMPAASFRSTAASSIQPFALGGRSTHILRKCYLRQFRFFFWQMHNY